MLDHTLLSHASARVFLLLCVKHYALVYIHVVMCSNYAVYTMYPVLANDVSKYYFSIYTNDTFQSIFTAILYMD